MMAKLEVLSSDKEVADKLCRFVVDSANKAISERGIFTVGFSGGSLAKYLCDGLPSLSTDWSKWRVFFCDERHVPLEDGDCTFKVYRDNLMNKVPLSHVVSCNPSVTVEEAAMEYESKIREVFPGTELPKFDMLLLGMGPDGHTCSLFPGHSLLQETSRIVAPISDSPKPPPSRITLTLPVINNCRCAVFVSCGAGKAEMVKRVIEGTEPEPLPAARVQPTDGTLMWFLDKGAAGLLSTK